MTALVDDEIEGLAPGETVCPACWLVFWAAVGVCPTCAAERSGRRGRFVVEPVPALTLRA